MKVLLEEIWEFLEHVPRPVSNKGSHWNFDLAAGDIKITNLRREEILGLKDDEHFDPEFLPSIFTFREVLWQPNVYLNPAACLPQLRILKSFCSEYIGSQKVVNNRLIWPQKDLILALASHSGEAIKQVSRVGDESKDKLIPILGAYREKVFPIIKFFVFHPLNRTDYKKDAIHRMNYAVKIMLSEYRNNYLDLADPFWEVSVTSAESAKENSQSTESKDHDIKRAKSSDKSAKTSQVTKSPTTAHLVLDNMS